MARNNYEEAGVFQKIQSRTGCLLLVIGVAMLAFVATDLINSRLMGGGSVDNEVGEIAGQTIDNEQFQSRVETIRRMYLEGNPGAPQPAEEDLKTEAWNQLIQELVMDKELEKVGVTTTAMEFGYVSIGDQERHPRVTQAFLDPNTQKFNKQRFLEFIETDIKEDESLMNRWLNFFEKPIKDEIARNRYNNLVMSSLYVTSLDAEHEFDLSEKELTGQAVNLSYQTISDSSITYDDRDLERFLKENSDDYQQEASRDLRYTMIYVFPSPEDTARVFGELESKINRFKEYQDDSTYVYLNRSDVPFDPTFKRRGSFNSAIEDQLFSLDTNEVLGPVFEDGSYSLYKVTGIDKDSIPHVRARHIYLSITEDQRADKIEEAKQFLADLNSGKVPFEELARANQDGTAAVNGDLGYIPVSGPTKVPEEIQKAVANGSVGQRKIVTTDKTIHIVEIMSEPSSKTIQVAILRKPILASGDTRRISERKAVEVSYQSKKELTFEEAAQEQGLQIRIAPNIKNTDLGFPGVVESKDVVKWLYAKDRKEGDISEATYVSRVVANKNFGAYVVAEVASIKEEGTAALKDVRDEVTDAYIRDQKAKKLAKQLEDALASSSTMEELAQAVNSQVTPIPVAKFSDDNVVNVRNSPKVQGALFALEEGAMSKPIPGGDGVYVVRVVGETEASKNREINLDNRKTFLLRMNEQRYGNLLLSALQEHANITDNRFRF